jgi:hypothetical protein
VRSVPRSAFQRIPCSPYLTDGASRMQRVCSSRPRRAIQRWW